MLRKKTYIEEHKTVAEKQLAVIVETLKAQGMTSAQILRDAKVRHFKGKIRQAKNQLGGIAELEKQIAHAAEIKAEKLAAPKEKQPKKKQAPDPVKKKAKKEKAAAAAEADE
ncbi:MAG: hypothetical protein ABIL58_07235 [Pseudomonadota bacterium]